MSSEKKDYGISTRLTLLGRESEKYEGFVNTPIYRGSTVLFKNLEDMQADRGRYTYGTDGNPTISSLEDAWSDLCGAAGTVMLPSGMAAISLALLAFLKSGDHLLMTDSVYFPSRRFCGAMLKKLGIETEFYDPLIGADIERLIRPNTAVVFLESLGSQTFEVQDVPTITSIARKHGIKSIIDNTWATPLFFQAHKHGCDLSIEAGTKYLSGHSDLLLGLVSANEESWPDLRKAYELLGMLPGPEDTFLALRGLRTLNLRLREVEKKAMDMAHWLAARPEVLSVLHPAFETCPGHKFWKRDFLGSSGVFSIILKPEFSLQGLATMLDNLSLFGLGYSWGGYESLATSFDCSSYRTVRKWKPEGLSIRLQIGLEDFDDLKNDLAEGFERLRENN